MELLHSYASDGDSDSPQPVARPSNKSCLNPAPQILNAVALLRTNKNTLSTTTKSNTPVSMSNILMNNPQRSVLCRPIQGPAASDPFGPKPQSHGNIGTKESNVAFDEVAFRSQRTKYEREGTATGPDSYGTVVSVYDSTVAQQSWNDHKHARKRPRAVVPYEKGHKDILVEGSDDDRIYGVWGPPTREERVHLEDSYTDVQTVGVDNLLPEQKVERDHILERDRQRGLAAQEEDREKRNFDKMVERKMKHLLPPRLTEEDPEPMEATTKFHGEEMIDYKGKSWMEPPPGVRKVTWGDMDDHDCFVPKKVVHRFTGHNKGVQRIRLFPKTGHLILSAGLEGKCKVWSIPKLRVMRTYIGHSAAVRDVQFSNDGSSFLSASFDRYIRLWDTESGKVINTFTNRRVPYTVRFYPKDNNFFVVGCSDNKIVTFNTKSGEVTQEYNHHLAPVNTIMFAEDDTKMVSCSDDKKILVWEWDIGVPIKYISDPTMHSIPVISKHPSDMYFIGQSLDNQIVVYQAKDRFAVQRKKKFLGHKVSGYACDLDVSPDGRFVVSGDGDGRLFFWDWRQPKVLQKFRAHDNGPTIGCVWHPVDPSLVISCGWDGVIKMWQ